MCLLEYFPKLRDLSGIYNGEELPTVNQLDDYSIYSNYFESPDLLSFKTPEEEIKFTEQQPNEEIPVFERQDPSLEYFHVLGETQKYSTKQRFTIDDKNKALDIINKSDLDNYGKNKLSAQVNNTFQRKQKLKVEQVQNLINDKRKEKAFAEMKKKETIPEPVKLGGEAVPKKIKIKIKNSK